MKLLITAKTNNIILAAVGCFFPLNKTQASTHTTTAIIIIPNPIVNTSPNPAKLLDSSYEDYICKRTNYRYCHFYFPMHAVIPFLRQTHIIGSLEYQTCRCLLYICTFVSFSIVPQCPLVFSCALSP